MKEEAKEQLVQEREERKFAKIKNLIEHKWLAEREVKQLSKEIDRLNDLCISSAEFDNIFSISNGFADRIEKMELSRGVS